MDIMDTIKEQIESNAIILYMKGSPNAPQCGFSARTVEALMGCGERFAYVFSPIPKFAPICRSMATGQLSRSCG